MLLVDDDEDARELLAELLVMNGCIVSAHGTVADALAALRSFAPDVAIVDLHLPDSDGLQLIRILRSTNVSSVRIAALTGLAARDMRTRALEAGANAFFAKPTRYTDLLDGLGLPRKS